MAGHSIGAGNPRRSKIPIVPCKVSVKYKNIFFVFTYHNILNSTENFIACLDPADFTIIGWGFDVSCITIFFRCLLFVKFRVDIQNFEKFWGSYYRYGNFSAKKNTKDDSTRFHKRLETIPTVYTCVVWVGLVSFQVQGWYINLIIPNSSFLDQQRNYTKIQTKLNKKWGSYRWKALKSFILNNKKKKKKIKKINAVIFCLF